MSIKKFTLYLLYRNKEKRKIMKNLELKNKVQVKLEAFGYSADTVADMLSSKLFNQALNAGYKTPKQISLYICNFH